MKVDNAGFLTEAGLKGVGSSASGNASKISKQRIALNFISFCIRHQVIRFGKFKTKAGRESPYFFNTGHFTDGHSLGLLAKCYADAIIASRLEFDVLFGPAYKGISLAAVALVALAGNDVTVHYAYNRKEVKDHGEGGVLVGAPLKDQRVLVLDDVMSAGTSVRESVTLIQDANATFAGVVIALDRQERGQGALSATQEVEATYNVPVISIATLDDLVGFLSQQIGYGAHLEAIKAYRDQYGAQL